MGLRLFFIISLALSLHRPGTASPIPDLHRMNYPLDTGNVHTSTDYRHGGFGDLPVNPRQVIAQFELPFNQHVEVGSHKFFSDPKLQNLADQHTVWIKCPQATPHTWVYDGEIYRELTSEEKLALHNYMDTYIIRSPREKRAADEIKKVLTCSQHPTENEKFVKQFLNNDPSQKLIAFGDMFKFPKESKPNEELTEEAKSLHPRLRPILAPDDEKEPTMWNLRPLVEIEDVEKKKRYEKRIHDIRTFFANLENRNAIMELLEKALLPTNTVIKLWKKNCGM